LHPGDGRLHSKFNQLEAETGRSSSSQPNAQNLPKDADTRSCFIADPPDEDEPGGYKLITVDMAGAELRIIAELAKAESWLNAFIRGEDVHSVGTEILYPIKWKEYALPNCKYYELNDKGEFKRQKCSCPEHKKLRDNTKAVNFLLAYGGGPQKLSQSIGVSLDEAKELMELHRQKFPDIWKYLEESGKNAKIMKESRDMFGRRRMFPDPTWELATEKAKDDRDEKLLLSKEEGTKNLETFLSLHNRKPTGDEKWFLVHRMPSQKEIANAYASMFSSIERQGKNHAIQGTNASLIKVSMGSGYDRDGKPFLWHLLPDMNAKLIAMVHDELIIQAPTRTSNEVMSAVGDAFVRAGRLVFSKIDMLFDGKVSDRWEK
jgi:DNA polymerase I-like protein with 3'-5' exonuclease and polymerase domains